MYKIVITTTEGTEIIIEKARSYTFTGHYMCIKDNKGKDMIIKNVKEYKIDEKDE